MHAKTWHRIYTHLDNQQERITHQRGIHRPSGTSPGIAIATDTLAAQWQRLERLKQRVGRHFCQALDRESRQRFASVID